MTAAITLAATAVVGAGISAYSAVSNANTQGKIAGQGLSQSATIFGEQQNYESMLQNLIANPSSVTSLPGYAFNQQQGEQAVARQMAGSGFLGSGNEAIALTQYGQNYATNAYTTQANLLASLSGLGSSVNPTQSLNSASGSSQAGNNSLQGLAGTLSFLGASNSGNGIFSQNGGSGLNSSNLFGGGSTANLFNEGQLDSMSTGFASPFGPYGG